MIREDFKENQFIVLTDQLGQKTYLLVDKKFYEGEFLCVVSDCEIYRLDGNYLKDCSLEVWKPRISEFCIFYNENSHGFRVSRFKGMCTGQKYKGYFKDLEGNQFKYCEPFKEEELPRRFKYNKD